MEKYNQSEKIQWCIEQHEKTNHQYDDYLAYQFHLRMVHQVFKDFERLLPREETIPQIELACFGHDLIEDCRVSYNDCEKVLGKFAADIIYAVTNEKGKTRAERANDKYYEGIRNTHGATFIKLCDRIANVQYSKLTKSSMFHKYASENNNFLEKVGADQYPEMKEYLVDLFEN